MTTDELDETCTHLSCETGCCESCCNDDGCYVYFMRHREAYSEYREIQYKRMKEQA